MSRNKDIRGFFGKDSAGRSSSQSLPTISSQPARDPHSSISTPSTPPKSTPKPRDRTDEIKGSDDEGGDSDDSLESITAFIEPKSGPAPYQRDTNLTSTPTAKRIASTSTTNIKSPLTIQPKHKYDLKYLIRHAQQSDRADESARRADELINQSEDDDDNNSQILTEVQNNPALLQKTANELLASDEEDANGDKLMRAMNRTKVDGSRGECYFFNLEQPLVKPPRKPFPYRAAKGWDYLANPRTRYQAIIAGLPHTVARKGKALPDEIFLWILDEICVEKNALLRMQYSNLVKVCPNSITRYVTEKRLYSMLEKLGGPKYSRSQKTTKFRSLPKVEDPYPRRDWTGLVTFLDLLELMAPNMSTQNAIGAIQLLLRIGLDPLVSIVVRYEHSTAMEALITSLPKPGTRQWNEACEAICTYYYERVNEPIHQVISISHMPMTSTKILDLRQRLAAVTLFRNPKMGSRPVDEVLTLDNVIDRLLEADFRVGPATDFDNLRALVTLLDITIDAAGFLARQHSSEEDGSRGFNSDIDTLTFQLKMVHDKIHDSTVLSRKMAKASIDLVSKRLTYAVRTRPPPKTSIFDSEPKEDTNLPKQRAFMKNWAQKKAERNATLASKNDNVDGDIE